MKPRNIGLCPLGFNLCGLGVFEVPEVRFLVRGQGKGCSTLAGKSVVHIPFGTLRANQ